MKKTQLEFLIRFIVIALLYFSINAFELLGFLLDIIIFGPFLCLFLISLIVCFFLDERKTSIIKLIITGIFTVLFTVQTVYFAYYIPNNPEAAFGIMEILTYSPMYVLFIDWLIQDIQRFMDKKNNK